MSDNSSYSDKKRINEYLHAYWDEKCGDKPYPLEKEISVSELDAIWDSCFLVKVMGEGDDQRFSYIYLGKELIEAYGDDSTDKEICERLAYPSSMSLLHKFREVVSTSKPVDEDAEFVNTRNMLVKYRSSMLPLGKNDGEGVGFIIGGMKWLAY